MPIAPELMIGLCPEPGMIDLERKSVERYNGFPDSQFSALVGFEAGEYVR
jgi:hypothetical protein